MTALPYRSLALPGFMMLALSACANPSAIAQNDASPQAGVDLGPSTRVPRTQGLPAGAGHAAHHGANDMARTDTRPAGDGDVRATGTVNSVDPGKHTINLNHAPIPALGWPAMTMDFPVARSVDLNRIEPGIRVDFSLGKDEGGTYQIQSVVPVGGGRR